MGQLARVREGLIQLVQLHLLSPLNEHDQVTTCQLQFFATASATNCTRGSILLRMPRHIKASYNFGQPLLLSPVNEHDQVTTCQLQFTATQLKQLHTGEHSFEDA